MFEALLSFTSNDNRPQTTETLVETLQILNAILGTPDELGETINQSINQSIDHQEGGFTHLTSLITTYHYSQ